MKKFWIVFILIGSLSACSGPSDDPIIIDARDDSPAEVNFEIPDGALLEGAAALTVNLVFSRDLPADLELVIAINSGDAVVGTNFLLTPAPVNGELRLSVPEGSRSVSFQVGAIEDENADDEIIAFTLQTIDQEGVELGDNLTYTLRILDSDSMEEPNPVSPEFQACITPQSSQTLEVVTWNIERFPMASNSITEVIDIIENMQADIIAVQEISSTSAFNTVANNLEDWSGVFFNVRGGIELGYFYKNSEIASISQLEAIFPNMSSPFPREPVVVEVTHINGLTVKLVNIHLKCCNDPAEGNSPSDFDRRLNASNLMKNLFDSQESETNLIVLGDFNDDILNGSPFQNFLDDDENYQFTDLSIAMGSTINWSFPSFPSHLDHILISNELFDNIVSTSTLRLERCVAGYSSDVSDHRPVMAVFRAD